MFIFPEETRTLSDDFRWINTLNIQSRWWGVDVREIKFKSLYVINQLYSIAGNTVVGERKVEV